MVEKKHSEVADNRRWNFQQITNRLGTNEVARRLGKNNSQISAVVGETRNRNIGNRFAQQIENEFGLPPGSLDLPPPPEALKHEDRYLAEINSTLANATDDDKELVLGIAQWVVKRSLSKNSDLKDELIQADQV